MKDYRLYLFDFDYTLADSEAGILKCFHCALRGTGYPDVADDAIRRTIGLPMADAVQQIIKGTKEEARAFIEAYRPLADRYMTEGTVFFPRALETLRTLKKRGAGIAIVSNKTGSRIQEKFDRDGARLRRPHRRQRRGDRTEAGARRPLPCDQALRRAEGRRALHGRQHGRCCGGSARRH